MPGSTETLELLPTELLYRDERSGRTVLRGEDSNGSQVSVVADLSDATLGIPRRFSGRWTRSEKYGPQFEADAEIDPDLDARLAEGFLASGLVAHVGPSTARAIVEAFGAESLRVALDDPRALLGVRGITEARLPALRRSLREHAHLAGVVGLLDPFSVSLSAAKRVWRRHGAAAVSRISANPYRLIREIRGIGFTTADRIALGIGLAPDAEARLDAALIEAMRLAATVDGHTVVAEVPLVAAAAQLVGTAPEPLRLRLPALIADGTLLACADPKGVALPYLYEAEGLIATKVRLMTGWSDPDRRAVSDAELAAASREANLAFDPSQERAIRGALDDRVTIITGGPGTGKTTIVRAVLDIAEARGLSIALVAPTGRAAKRLAEATGRPAQTVHRWLRYKPSGGYEGPVDLADLVVVDEASMLDVPLAARVFSALPPFSRLLLVGDVDQLPAIGPGNVLGDLIGCPQVAVFRLREIHRQADGSSVPMLAADILAGERSPRFDGLTTKHVERETAEEVRDWIVAAIAKAPERAIDVQVLAPGRRGPCGVDALNRALQELLNPAVAGDPEIKRAGERMRAGDRIIATSNNYEHELFNGDLGYLREVLPNGRFRVELDGIEREFPPEAATVFSLAYALSVHRAQGSEFPTVVVALHQSAFLLLERRLFYTAVSRARRAAVVVGPKKAVSIAVSRHDPHGRRTRLRQAVLVGANPSTPVSQPGAPGAPSTLPGSAILADPDFDF